VHIFWGGYVKYFFSDFERGGGLFFFGWWGVGGGGGGGGGAGNFLISNLLLMIASGFVLDTRNNGALHCLLGLNVVIF